MKITRAMAASAAVLFCAASAFAQKKALDHDVYDSWQSVANATISDNGRVLVYQVNPQQGDGKLYFRNLSSGQELVIERGQVASLTEDSHWAIFNIKAPYAETRQAKIKKKKPEDMPKDTLCYVNLETFEVHKIANASAFKATLKGQTVFSFDYQPKKGPKEKTAPKKQLVLLNPVTGQTDTLKNVSSYRFNEDATKLAVVFKKDKKDSLSRDEAVLYKYPSMEKYTLSQDQKYYSNPEFSIDGRKLVFLASLDSNATGNKHCSVLLYEETTKGKGRKAITEQSVKEILPADYKTAGGLCITENSNPVFSKNSSRVIIGAAECMPAKDTSIVDFETAQVDIWNWDVYMTPPMQKKRLSQLKSATCSALIELSKPGELMLLADDPMVRVSYAEAANSDIAMMVDSRDYQVNSTWDSNSFSDVYLLNLKDGSRKEIAKKLNGRPSLSPTGKFITWYSGDDLAWHSYCIATGEEKNLTQAAGVPFYDEEDDHPMTKPAVDRPHWIDGDKAFLMTDKFDIWKFDPTGKSKPICLTEGTARKNGLQMDIVDMTRNTVPTSLMRLGEIKYIGTNDNVYLTVFDRATKENGYATVNVAKPGVKNCFTAKNSFPSAVKALNADVIAFRKGDYQHPYDIYTTEDFFATDKQWSHINPQQADYNWGDIQLVHWNAYDGTSLDGLLVTPEDLDPTKKYPMIIYFYEKNSETLYSYRTPAPSRSTVNISFFASRGYVVFIPDIVYKDGHPGESGYNCICSGAEAMCDQFSFIDKSKMGIQGQSWGGYQTAYLVTRTNMFAAAGAGAPVGNMTSAYGGIRWESGMVRAMQYEHGQSRIGKSMWEDGGLELYIENSPVFHTENVTTPTLIMHNDADGAVPWYQGIEFFMALRRFHHPAWLLEYNNEAHNLLERRNCKDLSMRLSQFFDHYLKGEPMPAWMKNGVPTTRKGEYFGFEYVNE